MTGYIGIGLAAAEVAAIIGLTWAAIVSIWRHSTFNVHTRTLLCIACLAGMPFVPIVALVLLHVRSRREARGVIPRLR